MAVSRLTTLGLPGRAYGTFSAKSKLGTTEVLIDIQAQTATVSASGGVVSRKTELNLFGIPAHKHSRFIAKAHLSGGTVTGSGTPQATTATITAVGLRNITGSGSPQAATGTMAGAGARVITGSGAHDLWFGNNFLEAFLGPSWFGNRQQAQTATSAGTSASSKTGSGSPQAQTATISATGIREITGSGTPQATTATTSVSGDTGIIKSGTGAVQADTATVVGVGARVVTGTGSPQADTATSSSEGGKGVIGSGAVQANAASISATVIFWVPKADATSIWTTQSDTAKDWTGDHCTDHSAIPMRAIPGCIYPSTIETSPLQVWTVIK